MKKLFFIFAFIYSFSSAANMVEVTYHLDENKAPCLYQSEYGESCKTCDSPESFRIIKAVRLLPCKEGEKCRPETILEDEKVCPQRKLICNKDGSNCYSALKECPKNFPLRAGLGCYSCNAEGMRLVKTKKDCDICSNRKIIHKGENLYCVFKNPPDVKQAPQNKPLVLKYGYQSCGYCVSEEDIVDCSRCLNDYTIINGKCKRKEGTACYQA